MHCVCPNGTIKHRYLNVCFCKHKQPLSSRTHGHTVDFTVRDTND